MSVFEFIGAKKAEFSVSTMCRVLGVSRAGFYAWRLRPVSKHARRDRVLVVKLRAVFYEHRGRYGAPRVHRALKNDGEKTSRKQVARLMRQQGLKARPKRRFVSLRLDSCTTLIVALSIPPAPTAP